MAASDGVVIYIHCSYNGAGVRVAPAAFVVAHALSCHPHCSCTGDALTIVCERHFRCARILVDGVNDSVVRLSDEREHGDGRCVLRG